MNGERKPRVLRTDFSAPLPLGEIKAIERAAELHALGAAWSWPRIADVMRVYHGFDRSASWWRRRLRGRVEPRPRGNAFTGVSHAA